MRLTGIGANVVLAEARPERWLRGFRSPVAKLDAVLRDNAIHAGNLAEFTQRLATRILTRIKDVFAVLKQAVRRASRAFTHAASTPPRAVGTNSSNHVNLSGYRNACGSDEAKSN